MPTPVVASKYAVIVLAVGIGALAAAGARVEAKPATLDPSKGQRLPTGGGAPGKAYLAFNTAVRTGDIKMLKGLMPAGEPLPPDAELKQMVAIMAPAAPADLRVVDGVVSGNQAVLTVAGTLMGRKQTGTIGMTLQGGVWTMQSESWK
jgi:hypothetical protein